MRDRISATQAAALLGVKPATLYAYVSRGLLHPERARDGRTSRFDPAEVAALAARGRRVPRAAANDLVVESALTRMDPEGRALWYRGRDAAELARTCVFEAVAELLWTGELPQAPPAWQAAPAMLAAARAAQAALPAAVAPFDRLRLIAAAAATADPLGADIHPQAVTLTARALLATLVEALPEVGAAGVSPGTAGGLPPAREGPNATAGEGKAPLALRTEARVWGSDGPPPLPSLAARLWSRLCPAPSAPGMVAVLNAALVLLADHELSASTLAARVAASVHAGPYAVAGAGLNVVSGALHGAASLAVERLLAEIATPERAALVLGERLRRGERLPGFGHLVYTGADPRMQVLWALLLEEAPPGGRLAVPAAVLAAVSGRALPPPNVDFALGAFSYVAGMTPGSGEAIFAVARVAGWLAHAIEEYRHRTRYRPRAVYVGPPPTSLPEME